MPSSIVVPNFQKIGNYLPKAVQAIVDVATAAQTDINAFSGAVSPVANTAALQALDVTTLLDGAIIGKLDSRTFFRYSATSTAVDASNNLVISPSVGVGAYLQMTKDCIIDLPVTFATADAAVLFTVPVGAKISPRRLWWDVSTSFTGGTSSAIGVSCSVSGFSTKGDLLGGAAGDVAATLVSTNTRMVGTVGTHGAPTDRLILVAGDTIKFDRITSAFTAGAATVRMIADLIFNPGA